MTSSSPRGLSGDSHHLQESYTRILALSIRNLESGSSNSPPNHSVRVTLNYPGGTISSSSTREIQLRLTNDGDPLFFFHLRINEQDYPSLKQNQGLLVDFNGFPAQLISLLEKCGDDKFLLVMNCLRDSTVLDIVESNPFKYLSHLSLIIQPGSDGDVKKYLSQVTTELKKENEALRTKFQHVHSSLESEVGKLKSLLEAKDTEILNLRDGMRTESSRTSEKYFRELAVEKEKLITFQSELSNKFETEKLGLEKRHREALSSLETKCSCLETDKRQLEQDAFRADTKIKEYENRIKCTEDDLNILNQELQILRKNNNKLDADYHEKQRVVGNLVNKLNAYEGELKEKVNLITRQQELISNLSEKGTHLDEKSQGLVRELEQTRVNLRNVGTDLIKANEIIRKLQEDGRHLGKRIKLQAQVLSTQESQLTEKSEDLTQLRKNLQASTDKCIHLEQDLSTTKGRADELEKLVETHEESVKSKENMITWLNKQLNEVQGLSNLNKFRQTMANSLLSESKNLNQTHQPNTTIGNEVPSWMNIYNSTMGNTSANTNNNTLLNSTAAGANLVNNNVVQPQQPSLTPPGPVQGSSAVLPPAGGGDQGHQSLTQRSVPSQKKVTVSALTARAATWARSNKAALDPLIQRQVPVWKK